MKKYLLIPLLGFFILTSEAYAGYCGSRGYSSYGGYYGKSYGSIGLHIGSHRDAFGRSYYSYGRPRVHINYYSRFGPGYYGGYDFHGNRDYSYGYSYPYGYRSYRRPSVYYDIAVLNNAKERTYSNRSVDARAQRDQSSVMVESMRAWTFLARGEYVYASQAFSTLSTMTNIGSNAPFKTGYALTSGFTGNLERATSWMRTAFRTDVEAALQIPDDPTINDNIFTLITEYQQLAETDPEVTDNHFMLAALNSLIGNYDKARDSLRTAIDGGDDKFSTTNLAAWLGLE